LASTTVARDRMVLVVGPEHPWADRGTIAPRELPDTEWVLREVGSGTRAVFEAAVSGFGLAPEALKVALQLPSNEAVRAAVEAGLGATVISASVAAPGLEAGLLRHVRLDLPERRYDVLRHRERYQSHAAAALLVLIANTMPAAGLPRETMAKAGHH
ncbi:MAG TPA: LysR substrate-binding domain-containing protein, partial [Rhodopila sp.]|nr:LysR substrate-binding domain-containing protein [Rhodopila sp.]